jgi:hypothetical protein
MVGTKELHFLLPNDGATELSRENHPNFCATRKQEFSKSCRYLHVYVSRRFCCLSCVQIPFFIPTMYSLFPFKAIQFHLVSEIVPLYLSSRYGHLLNEGGMERDQMKRCSGSWFSKSNWGRCPHIYAQSINTIFRISIQSQSHDMLDNDIGKSKTQLRRSPITRHSPLSVCLNGDRDA